MYSCEVALIQHLVYLARSIIMELLQISFLLHNEDEFPFGKSNMLSDFGGAAVDSFCSYMILVVFYQILIFSAIQFKCVYTVWIWMCLWILISCPWPSKQNLLLFNSLHGCCYIAKWKVCLAFVFQTKGYVFAPCLYQSHYGRSPYILVIPDKEFTHIMPKQIKNKNLLEFIVESQDKLHANIQLHCMNVCTQMKFVNKN